MARVSLVSVFGTIPDPRRKQGRRHPLPAILALICLATMCGRKSMSAVVQWGKDQGQEMARKLGFDWHGTPVQSTIHDLLKVLPEEQIAAALQQWAAGWQSELTAWSGGTANLEHICLDGKTLRGSAKGAIPCRHLLSVYAAQVGLVLGRHPAGAKENGGEIVAARAVLEGLVLEGRIVTGDAMFAQRDLCQKIVTRGGEYLLAVKDNQPRLLKEIEDVFRSPGVPLFAPGR